MDILEALEEFQTEISTNIDLYLDGIITNVGAFAGVIMFVYVASKIVKAQMNGSEKIDSSTLVRPCLTLAAIFLYTQLVEYCIETPVDIIEAILENGESLTGSSSSLDTMRDNMTYTQSEGGPDDGGINDIIQIHPLLEFTHMIVFFLASMAGGYVLFKQMIMAAIYQILGPFALALSLIPGNEGTVSKWFQGYLAILLWKPLLVVIQLIITIIPLESSLLDASDIIFSMAFQVVMVMTVFKIPEYANILVTQGSSVGGASVGAMAGKAGGVASMGAKKAYQAMSSKKKGKG